MSEVVVRYHHEPEGWWAETDDLPRFSASGSSYTEVLAQVRSALPELLGVLEDDLREVILQETGPQVEVYYYEPFVEHISSNRWSSLGSPIPRVARFRILRDQTQLGMVLPGNNLSTGSL